ncbi:MAG TPA: hypothetical protein VFQ61_01305, partial [Polyangiaceae bacterium]|nr:hypothetical protein [Polyangiaceae bacterium]
MSRPPVRKPRPDRATPPLGTGHRSPFNPPVERPHDRGRERDEEPRAYPPRAADHAIHDEAPSSEWQDQFSDYLDEEVPELGVGSRMVPPEVRYEEKPEPAPVPKPLTPVDFEAQIRTLEARLDGLIRRATLAEESEAEAAPASFRSPGPQVEATPA